MAAVNFEPTMLATQVATQQLGGPFQPGKVEGLGLPIGFPSHVASKLAWTGSDFTRETDYVYTLSPSDIGELGVALARFKEMGLDGDCVARGNFRLPALGAKLDALSRDVHDGKGFCVIRGLDPEHYSVEDLTIIYLGVQVYIADQRGRQDGKGNMLTHIVADDSTELMANHHRHSTKAITFHNEEAGDVVGWLTRSAATAGGKCIIASAHTVYNIIAAAQPDLIRTLARGDWPFALPYYQCRPILYWQESKLMINFGRTPLVGSEAHPRSPDLPAVSAEQLEALDAVEAVARATEMQIKTQAGDMHFINNLAILHRREGFVDGVVPNSKRHLVRMRLRSTDKGWTVPRELEKQWDQAFGGDAEKIWHLEPMPECFGPLRKYPN